LLDNVFQAVGGSWFKCWVWANNLAYLYNAQGRYADAEPLYQRALAICEQRFGPNHPHVAVILAHYASLLRNMHRDTEAADLESRAAAIRTEHV